MARELSSATREPTPQTPVERDGSGAMFDGIAHRYDLLNRVMSMGIDQRWRRLTIRALALQPGANLLDLATGTADMAILAARMQPAVRVLGVDPSRGMLEVGRRKVEQAGLSQRVRLEVGEAERLEMTDASVDGVCIAFGIRNVADRMQGLREMARVTRPGGRVAILELSEPRRGLLSPLARFHIRSVVPTLGALLSGAHEYRYLQRSIAAFPPAEEFADMMRAAGLAVVSMTALTFGVCHLYVGEPVTRS